MAPAEHSRYDLMFYNLREQEGKPAPTGPCALTEQEHIATEDVASSVAVSRGEAIYVVPSFVKLTECDELMAAAVQHPRGIDPSSALPKQRIPVTKLPAVHGLCDKLIRRAHALLEEQLPYLAQSLFGQAAGLSDMDISFSLNEPAVNVYSEGGDFAQHEDNHMITVLVPLAEADAFAGGGTAFWPNTFRPGGTSFTTGASNDGDAFGEDDDLHHMRETKGDGLVMLPPRGTAMLFVGSVTHAGVCVDSGVRMVWVASFNLRPWKPGFWPTPGRLLVGNLRVGAGTVAHSLTAESHFAIAPPFGQQDDMEAHAYDGLRPDLRMDLAAAATAAELGRSGHSADDYEGLLDTLLDSRDRFRNIMADLQGSRLISELDQEPPPPDPLLIRESAMSAAEQLAAKETADGG